MDELFDTIMTGWVALVVVGVLMMIYVGGGKALVAVAVFLFFCWALGSLLKMCLGGGE